MHWWTTSWLNPKENPFSFLSQQSTSSINQQMCRLTTSQLEMKGNPFSFFLLQQSTSNVNQLCQLTTSTQNNGESFLFPFPTINLFYPSTIVLIHNLSTWNKEDFFLLPLRTINQNKINQWLHWSTTLLFDLSAIHVNGFPLLSQQSTITMTIKWLLLIKCCCIVQHIFNLLMLIDIYCGVKKENLTFPSISVNVSIACGTFSTGYKDTENVRILCSIQPT